MMRRLRAKVRDRNPGSLSPRTRSEGRHVVVVVVVVVVLAARNRLHPPSAGDDLIREAVSFGVAFHSAAGANVPLSHHVLVKR